MAVEKPYIVDLQGYFLTLGIVRPQESGSQLETLEFVCVPWILSYISNNLNVKHWSLWVVTEF